MAEGLSVRPTVLVVDDEPGVRLSFRAVLEDEFEVIEAEEGKSALNLVQKRSVDLVLLDIRLPGEMDGIQVLERIRALDEQMEVILVTAVKTLRTAVEAIKLGAYDYITKPFEVEELLPLVRRALQKRALEKEVFYLKTELDRRQGFDDIVGKSRQMQSIYDLIQHVAQTTATVLISGESGTGKELIARAIHRQGPRHDRPFVPVNCVAIPENLMESELFGHEKGAFTSAFYRRIGKFELANTGTLFLDEVGGLRMDLQAKLLRVIQEREFERIGGTKAINTDVRIIAATNVNLKQAVQEKQFREDLYYRLNVIPIHLPPLRERREDISLLVEHFLRKYNREFSKEIRGLSKGAMAVLQEYDWPGNVRELENIIERSVALARGPVVTLQDLPLDLALFPVGPAEPRGALAGYPTLREAKLQFERQLILRVLERTQWNQTEAARILGVHRNTLQLKLASLGLRKEAPHAFPSL